MVSGGRLFRSGISFCGSQIAVDVTLDSVAQCRQLELIHHFGVGRLLGSVNCLEVEEGFWKGKQLWFSMFDKVWRWTLETYYWASSQYYLPLFAPKKKNKLVSAHGRPSSNKRAYVTAQQDGRHDDPGRRSLGVPRGSKGPAGLQVAFKRNVDYRDWLRKPDRVSSLPRMRLIKSDYCRVLPSEMAISLIKSDRGC